MLWLVRRLGKYSPLLHCGDPSANGVMSSWRQPLKVSYSTVTSNLCANLQTKNMYVFPSANLRDRRTRNTTSTFFSSLHRRVLCLTQHLQANLREWLPDMHLACERRRRARYTIDTHPVPCQTICSLHTSAPSGLWLGGVDGGCVEEYLAATWSLCETVWFETGALLMLHKKRVKKNGVRPL